MGDEDKNVNQDDLTNDDDNDDTDVSKKKSYTPEEYARVCSEAKTYRKDKAAIKKERDEFETKFKALENEKLTELEKERNKNIELEKKLADKELNENQAKIDNLILKATAGKNFIKIDTAILLIKKELENEEEVNEKVIEKAIEKLIKDEPYLISSGNPNPSSGNFGKQDNEPVKDTDAIFGDMLRGIKK